MLAQRTQATFRAFQQSKPNAQPIRRTSVKRNAMIMAEYTAYVKGDPAANKLADVSIIAGPAAPHTHSKGGYQQQSLGGDDHYRHKNKPCLFVFDTTSRQKL